METREILEQTPMDFNNKELTPKGYHVDCVVLTNTVSVFVYSLTLTRMSIPEKVTLTVFLDNQHSNKQEMFICLQELMIIMGVP